MPEIKNEKDKQGEMYDRPAEIKTRNGGGPSSTRASRTRNTYEHLAMFTREYRHLVLETQTRDVCIPGGTRWKPP